MGLKPCAPYADMFASVDERELSLRLLFIKDQVEGF
jgi:hypothetical protein